MSHGVWWRHLAGTVAWLTPVSHRVPGRHGEGGADAVDTPWDQNSSIAPTTWFSLVVKAPAAASRS
jgi:hypothetical protein